MDSKPTITLVYFSVTIYGIFQPKKEVNQAPKYTQTQSFFNLIFSSPLLSQTARPCHPLNSLFANSKSIEQEETHYH